ncbi:3-deoxy-manno-octulosonate cytidylyltransferase [Thermanaerothrix sp.]|jgi:3-deoxy-manno-octulosonate cytidylyltransferase (CMP-KDO synthetase)|uniref:3-deoxy-manno-octulosonate cytidylyltransferase n=1 Tax=Thermanaerothrix sp. TaxID=2972675 RepID=UPI002ADE0D3D|nr:3-deoxy-manno-octulosonate cytidylyltransferase [Thermanaerothrix sp.]
MDICAVIPARLESKRLPRKVLADIRGQPMLWHVWQRARQSRLVGQVIVATDAEEILHMVRGWGGEARLTSPACQSGSERIASLVSTIEAEFIINVQGDEPLLDPILLDELVQTWLTLKCDIVTPVYRILDLSDLFNPSVVKVVRNQQGRALYFSRQSIPYVRDLPTDRWLEAGPFWGHVGVYGFQRAVLESYASLPLSLLEQSEKLEQLRFMEAGYEIYTVETNYRPIAVDTWEDLERVRGVFSQEV